MSMILFSLFSCLKSKEKNEKMEEKKFDILLLCKHLFFNLFEITFQVKFILIELLQIGLDNFGFG